MLRFYCDESYNSRVFVVAGFLAHDEEWKRLEFRWDARIKTEGIRRFHDSDLNSLQGEFKGWSIKRQIALTKDLLGIIQKRKIIGFSSGVLLKDYEETTTKSAREKLGEPYVVCFKHCIAQIAEGLVELPKDEGFSVIFDRNDLGGQAIEIFSKMRDDERWEHRHRLLACASGSWENIVGLQAADLIAFETYKLLDNRHYTGRAARKALQTLLGKVPLYGKYFDREALLSVMKKLENIEGSVIVTDLTEV